MSRALGLILVVALAAGLLFGLQLLGVLPETVRLPKSEELASIESPDMVFFEKVGCARCRNMKKSLARLLLEFPDVSYVLYDVDEDAELLLQLMTLHGLEETRELYPVIFVGETVVIGEGLTEELALRTAMEGCHLDGCPSPLELLGDASL